MTKKPLNPKAPKERMEPSKKAAILGAILGVVILLGIVAGLIIGTTGILKGVGEAPGLVIGLPALHALAGTGL